MPDTPDSIVHTLRQGMGQFAMTTYYQLCGMLPVQEAAQKTLEVIDSVRNLFLTESAIDWRNRSIDMLWVRYKQLKKFIEDHDEDENFTENLRREIYQEMLALQELCDKISSMYEVRIDKYEQGN